MIWNQEAADKSGIPKYMQPGLERWIEDGIEPGNFLCAILQNDLLGAFLAADARNLELLTQYVKFLYNYAPADCWGSAQQFESWRRYHRKQKEGGVVGERQIKPC